jgi:hypothetical protein
MNGPHMNPQAPAHTVRLIHVRLCSRGYPSEEILMNGPHMNAQAPRTRSGHSRKAVFTRLPLGGNPHEWSTHESPSPAHPLRSFT